MKRRLGLYFKIFMTLWGVVNIYAGIISGDGTLIGVGVVIPAMSWWMFRGKPVEKESGGEGE